jgi:transposase
MSPLENTIDYRDKMSIKLCDHAQSELCQKYGVHPTAVQRWKKELMESGAEIFNHRKKKKEDGPTVDDLQRKIGQLTMDLDFLKKALGK